MFKKRINLNTNSYSSAWTILKNYVDGYVIPRNKYYDQYKEYSQIELIRTLYLKFKNFIDYVKGTLS